MYRPLALYLARYMGPNIGVRYTYPVYTRSVPAIGYTWRGICVGAYVVRVCTIIGCISEWCDL
jgi:hypothetical protein